MHAPAPEALDAAVATAEWVDTSAQPGQGGAADAGPAGDEAFETPQHGRRSGESQAEALPVSAAALQAQQTVRPRPGGALAPRLRSSDDPAMQLCRRPVQASACVRGTIASGGGV